MGSKVLKMNEEKNAVMLNENGYPILIITDDEGTQEEVGVDLVSNYESIPALRAEAKKYRLQSEAALKPLQDNKIPTEPDKLKDWAETSVKNSKMVANLDKGDLVKAETVEQIKKEAAAELEDKLSSTNLRFEEEKKELEDKNVALEDAINSLHIEQCFNDSKFVEDKLNMTTKMARAYFAENFKVEMNEAGKRVVTGYYNTGDKILDPQRDFGVADFDEAMQRLVAKDPDKNSLLIGKGAGSGSGAHTAGGTGGSINPWKPETENLTEQGKIVREDPGLAAMLKKEAGVG